MKLFRLLFALTLLSTIFSGCQDDLSENVAPEDPALEISLDEFIRELKSSGETNILPKITEFMLARSFVITTNQDANARDNFISDVDSDCVKERSFVTDGAYTYHFTEYSEGCTYYSGCTTVSIFSLGCNGLCSFETYC